MDNVKQEILSRASGDHAKGAISSYAIAAACEELVDDGSHAENQMFFVVRALCNEHGVDYGQQVIFARERARQISYARMGR